MNRNIRSTYSGFRNGRAKAWIEHGRDAVTTLGLRNAIRYISARVLSRSLPRSISPQRVFALRAPGVPHRLYWRPHTSDLAVFRQIFIVREYAPLDDLADVDFVLDCGAYVGYSTLYFLSRFPRATVLALEPNNANFSLLQRNLAPYGSRATPIHAAVWPHPASLAVATSGFRDSREWSTHVREVVREEGAAVQGIDIGTLLERSGRQSLPLLKLDVEGAESLLFSEGYQGWLDRVENLVIELHDDSPFGPPGPNFYRAIAPYGFHVTEAEERVICRKYAPAANH